MMNYNNIFYLLICFLCSESLFGQVPTFLETSEQLEKLLRYEQKSPNQLRELLTELEHNQTGFESEFQMLKTRVDRVLLPLEIKFTKSDIYNKDYKNAVQKIGLIKVNYKYDEAIQKLENYFDRKLFHDEKKTLLASKPHWFSVEPSIAFYSSEIEAKNFNTIQNLNPVYGLGLYVRMKNKPTTSSSGKLKFNYSQIGLKLDYRDPNYTYKLDTATFNNTVYFNSQLSYLYKQVLGIDVGIISYSTKIDELSSYYSFTGSFYIPMGWMSLGVNARIITDFLSTNPLVQIGTTLKFNLGLYKPFNNNDKEEVKAKIIKFKEANSKK